MQNSLTLEMRAKEIAEWFPIGRRNIDKHDHETLYKKILDFGHAERLRALDEAAKLVLSIGPIGLQDVAADILGLKEGGKNV